MLNSRYRSKQSSGEKRSSSSVGLLGERIAARWLFCEGWRILRKNYRAKGGGEVDIACRDHDTLVFVEVKTRTSREHGRPLDAVNTEKEQLIIRGAMSWLTLLDNQEVPYRFDVIEVLLIEGEKPFVNLVQSAFQMPEQYRFN